MQLEYKENERFVDGYKLIEYLQLITNLI